jgi:pyridoxal 5'-phosphate synthase pdxT subunit
MKTIGVLALQGGFAAHAAALARAGYAERLVRHREDTRGLDGLVLPGGESTAQWSLLLEAGLDRVVCDLARAGLPMLATCAGLILVAREVVGPEQASLGLVDVSVRRNGWGRQIDSFDAELDGGGLSGVFIRAPRIERVGEGVEVMGTLRGEPVLVRSGSLLCATFHPELTADGRVYEAAFMRPDAHVRLTG